MPQAVIFDIDGTLLDSNDLHAESWSEAFAKFGYVIAADRIRDQIGKGGDQLLPVFLGEDEVERIGERIEAYRAGIFKREYLPKVRAFAGVRPLVERVLRDGAKVALASSAKSEEIATYRKIAQIDDLIDAETSSDDAERSKPHPDIFAAALERLGLEPDQTVVVGDTPYDAIAAGKLGIPVVGLLCGGFPEAGLREAGCSKVFENPVALLDAFDRSPLASG